MKLKRILSDTMTMSNRIIKYSTRSVDTIITVLVTPIMMLLLFVYVFGGAINTGDVKYVTYIVPGILIMCIGSAVAYTALRVSTDVTKGIFERFHSMPIAKSSLLAGHVISSVILNVVSVIAILGVAFLMGFRPEANIIEWILIILILLLTILAMTSIAVTFGIKAKTAEGAGVFSYIIIFGSFISSAFVPTDTMPTVLRVVAEHQPITPIIESIRSLTLGNPADNTTIIAISWCLGLIILFYILAMKAYKNRMK